LIFFVLAYITRLGYQSTIVVFIYKTTTLSITLYGSLQGSVLPLFRRTWILLMGRFWADDTNTRIRVVLFCYSFTVYCKQLIPHMLSYPCLCACDY